MVQTVEAIVDEIGRVRLLEEVHLPAKCRALVTILQEEPIVGPCESALLSERSLSDWNRPEEDAAWAHLQRGT